MSNNHKVDVDVFSKFLYSRLPEYYRYIDKKEGNNLLERFIDVLNSGGFYPSDKLSVGLIDLSQISKCPEEYLDVVGHSLGVDWIREIDDQYKRRILRSIIEIYKIKGSVNSLEHIARSISGFDVKVIENYIPEADFIEGEDETKRLTTIQLYSPHFDDYDPSKTDMDLDTIKYVVAYFVPVHTKFIVVVTYFYLEDFELSGSTTEQYKGLIQNKYGEVQRQLNVEETNLKTSFKMVDDYITSFFPNNDKKGTLGNEKISFNFNLSPYSPGQIDGYEYSNIFRRFEGEETRTLEVEEFTDFTLNLKSNNVDVNTTPEIEDISKINLMENESCGIINLTDTPFTPRLTFKDSKLNGSGLILTPVNNIDVCKVNKNGVEKIIFI